MIKQVKQELVSLFVRAEIYRDVLGDDTYFALVRMAGKPKGNSADLLRLKLQLEINSRHLKSREEASLNDDKFSDISDALSRRLNQTPGIQERIREANMKADISREEVVDLDNKIDPDQLKEVSEFLVESIKILITYF